MQNPLESLGQALDSLLTNKDFERPSLNFQRRPPESLFSSVPTMCPLRFELQVVAQHAIDAATLPAELLHGDTEYSKAWHIAGFQVLVFRCEPVDAVWGVQLGDGHRTHLPRYHLPDTSAAWRLAK